MQAPRLIRRFVAGLALCAVGGCAATSGVYRNESMDFGSLQTVAVMPFANLSREVTAGDRVRDVFTTMLLATGALYVLPVGEVAKGITKVGVANPVAPTADEVVKLCSVLKADAVITGVVREYGEVRSGTASANAISLSVQMAEGQTGKVIWSAASTKGGVGLSERLFGGGGDPLNQVTEKAVEDVLKKLFE